jgi:hypothetical protein
MKRGREKLPRRSGKAQEYVEECNPIRSSYKGRMFIDKKFVFDNRKARYKVEEELFETYGYIIIRDKKIDPIIKFEMKFSYYEPLEGRQVLNDYERDVQTIDYHFKVGKLCPAADSEVKSEQLNGK